MKARRVSRRFARVGAAAVLALALSIAVAAAGCEDAAPTPAYAQAQAAYAAAMKETADTTYLGKQWDEVLSLLRAVPSSNAHERTVAQALVQDIEQARARAAAAMKRGDAEASKLLQLESFAAIPPPPPPDAGAAPAAPGPIAQATNAAIAAREQCIDGCSQAFNSCIAASGCQTTASTSGGGKMHASYSCPSEAAAKGAACQDALNVCVQCK